MKVGLRGAQGYYTVVLSPVYHSRTHATATDTTITIISAECVLRAVAQEHQEAVTSTICANGPQGPVAGGRAQVIIGISCRATRGAYASPLISAFSTITTYSAFGRSRASEKDGARCCFGFASGKVCRRRGRLRQLVRSYYINYRHMLERGATVHVQFAYTVLGTSDMHAVNMPGDV